LRRFLRDIKGEFGKEALLTVSQGKVHNYLGMRIKDYSEDGKVLKITVPDMIEAILSQLPPSGSHGLSIMPEANHLFQVNPHGKSYPRTTPICSIDLPPNCCTSASAHHDQTFKPRYPS